MQNLGWQTKSIMVCYGIFWCGQFFCSLLSVVLFFSVRGLCPPERGNHIFVYPADSCGQDLGPLWRAVSKRWGLSERTHWFCVQGRPIRVKNYICVYAVSKKFRIRVDVTLWHCHKTLLTRYKQRELYLPSLKAICVWSVVSAIYDKQARIMAV